MHSRAELAAVLRLVDSGARTRDITALTGVPRATVNRWRRRPPTLLRERPVLPERWRPHDRAAYSYLLGLYLGDGHLCGKLAGDALPESWMVLFLTLDRRYQDVIREAAEAIQRVVPDTAVQRRDPERHGATILSASHPIWRCAFPQHGAGPKHKRRIELGDWQLEITRRHPRELLRGLVHSDGSRTVNRFSVCLQGGRVKEYSYVRYFFTNASADIRGIFCDHSDLLGIRWTQSNARNISVAYRPSVVLLGSFIGPKS